MRCRQCGNALSAGATANSASPEDRVDASGDALDLCFFCAPENDASRADRQVWMDAADKVVVPAEPPPTPKRWSGTITIVDDDWERLHDVCADFALPRKKATDYYAILDEPDAFDERAWLNFMGAEYAIEHIDGASDSSAA